MNIEEELQLVSEAQESVDAFEELYELYFPKVYGFVMSKVRSQELAEDLTSEIFLKILGALPKFRPRGLPFGAWVFQIVRNHLKDYYKKAQRTKHDQLEDPTWLPDEDNLNNPVKTTKRRCERAELIRSFDVLSSMEEEMIRLKYFSELSNKEIAKTLKLSANYVGVTLYRALQKLKVEYDS